VRCGERLSRCVCGEPEGHGLPHRCGELSALTGETCTGAWNSAEDIVTYPGGAGSEGEAWVDAVLLGLVPPTTRRGGARFDVPRGGGDA